LTLIRNVLGDLEALRRAIIKDFGVGPTRVWVKNASPHPTDTHPLPSATFLHPPPPSSTLNPEP